jgi:hypothetical protein
MPQPDLEQRVDRLEQLLDRAITAARQYPLGRKILAMLGLS